MKTSIKSGPLQCSKCSSNVYVFFVLNNLPKIKLYGIRYRPHLNLIIRTFFHSNLGDPHVNPSNPHTKPNGLSINPNGARS